MRRIKGPSAPGRPPHAHAPVGLKAIEFDVRETYSIIGPKKFPRSNFFNKPVPRVQEFGGRYIFSSYRRRGVALYPERSYMWNAVKSLHSKGKIQPKFNITLARNL